MKFKAGDEIISSAGVTGRVVTVKFADNVYEIQWDSSVVSYEYKIDDIDDNNELLAKADISAAAYWDRLSDEEWMSITGEKQGGCSHELAEYHGFSESYKYCKKCDYKERL